jgi:4-phosphopantoate--beta-alanine ligase
VIVIDLNPLSRSAQQGTITVVDELSRALNTMLDLARVEGKVEVDATYDHASILREGLAEMLASLNR